jgi:uracil-DNA glycosylase
VDRALTEAICDIARSARSALAELIEEGVDSFDDPMPESTGAVSAPTNAAASRLTPTPEGAGPWEAANRGTGWGPHPTLDQVRATLGDCRRCALCERRRQIVFGDGNPQADLMFVGEAPGAEEDRRGVPFVGRAGELLTAMIEKGLGIRREDVYICNIIKCRPPENRTPLAAEVSACSPFLDGQIAAVAPRVIVTLGKPAASLLLGRDVSITRIRGTWQIYGDIPVMPTFHPAYLLRQYTDENRRNVWQDLKAALVRARELSQ